MPIEFIKICYCASVPILLVLSFMHERSWTKTAVNMIAVSNLLLIGNSIFLGQQLYGFYEWAQVLGIRSWDKIEPDYWLALRIWCILLVPFFSLLARVRKNRLFTLLMLLLLYSFYPPSTWYLFEMFYKAIMYACLFCSVYALLWLCNQLPYQSPNR